jgi:GT2 family glycosyltransferase
MKKLSVVIPTYQRTALLRECLRLLNPEVQGWELAHYEVIVTDDCPSASARTQLAQEFPWVKWIQGPGRGPSANRNNGIQHAEATLILLTDDDCLPQTQWLSAYWEAHNQHPQAFLEGKTLADRPQQRWDEEAPINQEGGLGWSCNIAFAKHAFLQVGGFDEGFPYPAMEDVDFHFRMTAQFPAVFVPKALIIHPWRRIEPWKRTRMQYASRLYFYRKHQSRLGKAYRWHMSKSFLVTVLQGGWQLLQFGGKGFSAYLAQCVLRFKLIFGK